MAGLGDRFIKAGFDKPKPLIEIFGRTMISRVYDSLPYGNKIAVTRKYNTQHDGELFSFLITKNIQRIEINYVTEGAACTCLLAKELIDNDQELLIVDCDAFYQQDVYWFIDKYIRPDNRIGACGVCFDSSNPRNSYVEVDKDGWAIRAAEKEVISNLSFTGMHWWRKGSDFVKSVEKMIAAEDRTNGEFYVSPAYNHYIKDGGRMKPLLIPNNWVDQVGVPQDLVNYLNKYASIRS
ncbi:MAG TPA: glycosyltransferase family 2 protein [Saprospiraceae bacterium]|nr:glycosyltransferase family 2 protein [Saprospiraceae bacterium]